ncbi:YigZ family protein [Lacticaseibacillus saniviri]
MTSDYRTIAHDGVNEMIIKKSRFITTMARVHTTEEAEALIARVKKEHYKANHSVSAFQLGDHDQVQRAHDDGEPSGTAGAPTLQVLQQMQLKDVVAVTTRYFGGIKLGAGGLIRAYANSVSEAAHALGIVRLAEQVACQITISYAQLGSIQNYLAEQDLQVDQIDYAADVTVHLFVDTSTVDAFSAAIIERFNNQLTLTRGDKRFREIPVTE